MLLMISLCIIFHHEISQHGWPRPPNLFSRDPAVEIIVELLKQGVSYRQCQYITWWLCQRSGVWLPSFFRPTIINHDWPWCSTIVISQYQPLTTVTNEYQPIIYYLVSNWLSHYWTWLTTTYHCHHDEPQVSILFRHCISLSHGEQPYLDVLLAL